MSDPVRTEVHDQTLLIVLDRPPANAIDVTTSQALYAAFARLDADDALRVGVLTGGGERFFSAGWDLKAAVSGESIDADHGLGGFGGLTEYFDLRKPVIAAVNGLALGGGFELALAADLLVAAEHAEFALTEVRMGMVADAGGLLRLPRRVPAAIANELLLTARRMPAAEAHRWGLVNRVAPAQELLGAALLLAEDICLGAPLSIAAVKEVTAVTTGLDVRQGYARMRRGDLSAYAALLTSQDASEGPRAFAERRPPRWQGR